MPIKRRSANSAVLRGTKIVDLAKKVEEATRSTKEGVKYFIEPADDVLSRAKNKRHHIIFGRRGSGKSSLLAKLSADLTISRTPIAYVDLEEFKGHSYPDVLLSILLRSLTEFKKWLDTAATAPANKTSFWQKLFGTTPTKSGFDRKKTVALSAEFEKFIKELNDILFSADDIKVQETRKVQQLDKVSAAMTSGVTGGGLEAKAEVAGHQENENSREIKNEYTSKKIEILHQNIIRYKTLFEQLAALSDGPIYLLLDDLYHIRISDQSEVIDYFHRVAKGCNVWLKIGTIRHRSKWYIYGNPPKGMKLGDDADEIDLDVTLEKYDLTKQFLVRILDQFARECFLRLDDLMTEGARNRLVLASGGVARDFLTIFRRAIDVGKQRVASKGSAATDKVTVEDVNVAAGEYDKFKREDFTRDAAPEESDKLLLFFHQISEFCLNKIGANCFLVDKNCMIKSWVQLRNL